MENFIFQNPVKLIMGHGMIAQVEQRNTIRQTYHDNFWRRQREKEWCV